MPLRLLEVTIPERGLDDISEIAGTTGVLDVSHARMGNDLGLVRVLLEAEATEALSDRFVESFGSADGFRLVLLPVEATVPAPPVDQTDDGSEQAEASSEPRRISRDELYEDIGSASRLTRVYVLMVGLSTIVAAVGLIRGDVAVIVGAMVIAPLLGPNVALALACTLGDLGLARRSLKAIGAGVATAFLISAGLGAVIGVDPSVPEIASRTGARLGDVFLALAAGAAGSLSFTSGVPAVLVGVMVAVALLPPLVVAGLLAGAGHGAAALGALALVLANVSCVNLAAVATFLVQRVRPRTWWEEDRAKRATRIAVATWVAMLAILIALIALDLVSTTAT